MPSIRDMIAKVESKESAKKEKKALTRGVRPDHIMSGAYGIGETGLVKGGATSKASELHSTTSEEEKILLAAEAKERLETSARRLAEEAEQARAVKAKLAEAEEVTKMLAEKARQQQAEEVRQSIANEIKQALAREMNQSAAAVTRETSHDTTHEALMVSTVTESLNLKSQEAVNSELEGRPAPRQTEKSARSEKETLFSRSIDQGKIDFSFNNFKSSTTHTEEETVHAQRLEIDGFFKTTHALFFDPSIRDLSGESFRVFLFLHSRGWQFANSNGQVRASISFIELALGVSSATISRALDELKTTGLIRMHKKDFKLGNIWEVQSLAVYRGLPTTAVPSPVAGSLNNPRAVASASQVSHGNESVSGAESAQADPYQPLNEKLRNYFLSVRPEPKRRSEKTAFNELSKSFSEDEISECHDYLKQHGALKTGMACHSPMSYLSLAMSEVLEAVNLDKALVESRMVNAKFEAQARAQEKEALAAEERDWQTKEQAFLEAFPDSKAQADEISSICRGNSVANYGPQLMRRFAINQWWIQRGN